MVAAKIEEIGSRDMIRVSHAATSLTKKDVDKRRHHCTSSREALLITEASSIYCKKNLFMNNN